MRQSKILVIGDDPAFREAATAVLEEDNAFLVVGSVSIKDSPGPSWALHPSVVLLDVGTAQGGPLQLIARLIEARASTKILISVEHPTVSQWVMSALVTAGSGVISKQSGLSVLRLAAETVASNAPYLDPVTAGAVKTLLDPRRYRVPLGLTHQEARVLALLPKGLSNREIAAILRISEQTVKAHVKQILRKLEVRGRAEASAVAVREGLA